MSLSKRHPKEHFTIGINDDVTHTSLNYDPAFSIESSDTVQCVFWGLGSDGTVGANKNSIKIIGEETANHAQGYFVYDSKKSGSVTISHLRFGPRSIHAPYLIGPNQADFVACHQFTFLERLDVLKYAKPGGVFLLDSIYPPEEVWAHLPQEIQHEILTKKLHLYVINAHKVASDVGMGGRINTIMQTCFFAISGILPREEAIAQIKKSIKKTYSKRGEVVVQQNFHAVDATLVHLQEVPASAMKSAESLSGITGSTAASVNASLPPGTNGSSRRIPLPMLSRQSPVPAEAPAFVRDVLGPMIAGNGDDLPVSKLPIDGTYPSGTAQLGETQSCPGNACVGSRYLYSMWKMCHGLPALGHPHEGV